MDRQNFLFYDHSPSESNKIKSVEPGLPQEIDTDLVQPGSNSNSVSLIGTNFSISKGNKGKTESLNPSVRSIRSNRTKFPQKGNKVKDREEKSPNPSNPNVSIQVEDLTIPEKFLLDGLGQPTKYSLEVQTEGKRNPLAPIEVKRPSPIVIPSNEDTISVPRTLYRNTCFDIREALQALPGYKEIITEARMSLKNIPKTSPCNYDLLSHKHTWVGPHKDFEWDNKGKCRLIYSNDKFLNPAENGFCWGNGSNSILEFNVSAYGHAVHQPFAGRYEYRWVPYNVISAFLWRQRGAIRVEDLRELITITLGYNPETMNQDRSLERCGASDRSGGWFLPPEPERSTNTSVS
jgi:hypothetical protein